MKRRKFYLVMFICFITSGVKAQVPFTPGNIVVMQVGDTVAALGSATKQASLIEFTPAGVAVQSIRMPIAVNGSHQPFTYSGTLATVGTITRSPDGQRLVAAGYAIAPGATLAIQNAAARVIALIGYNADINTTTSLPQAEIGGTSGPYSAVSSNGTDIWAVFPTTAGIRYTTAGATSGSILIVSESSLRTVGIGNGQLYVSKSASADPLKSVGSGLPTTSPQTTAALPGIPSVAATGQSQFFFADLDAGVAGNDVVYIASDGANALQKYSLVSGTWVSNGVIGADSDDYRQIDGIVSGTTVTLYAIRKSTTATTGSGELVTITDASGYNGAFAGTPNILATPAANCAFRGVAVAPVSSSCTVPSISAGPASASVCPLATATLNVTASGSGTLSYQWYQGNSGDESTPIGTNSNSFTTPPLTTATNYWVKITNACGNASSATATVSIYTSTTWTGSVNNDFNTAGNWSTNCVPTAEMNIIIPSGSPTLSAATATVNAVAINNGATLHLDDGGSLSIKGDCVNDGTIVSGGTLTDGKIIFDGTAAQNISGIGTFSKIEISNTVDVFAITNITVQSIVTLTGARFTANTGILVNIIQ